MSRMTTLTAVVGAAVAVALLSPGLAAATPGMPGIGLASPIASGSAAVPKPGGADFIHGQST